MAGSNPRRSLLLLLLPAAALLLLLLPAATAVCDAGDKAALLELKNSLRNPAALYSWRIATDCCDDWAATQCDSNGRVINVEISGASDAEGRIPPEIGGLSFLQALTLSKLPKLTGPIPAEICNLRQLAFLELQTNSLTGAIPDCIGQLRNLNYLSLAQNKLTGSIPTSLGSAYNIRDLYLDSNQLTGALPASLVNLQPLRVNISGNKLSGDVSTFITAWKTAETIDLSRNAFACSLWGVTFPTTLKYFVIKENGIYGNIPASCSRMTSLEMFDVSKNRLTGQVPSSMAGLPLRVVNLSSNQFSGGLRRLISSWARAETIDVSSNDFCFDLTDVQFPTGLKAFNVSSNDIYGTIPWSADSTQLTLFDVSNNELCGCVPQGGVINRFPATAFQANRCLCGYPMPSCDRLNCNRRCHYYKGKGESSSSPVAVSR